LLVLVALYGILVFTGTPVRQIPERLRSLSGHAPAQETEPEPEPELAGKSDVRLRRPVPASTGRSGHRRRDAAGLPWTSHRPNRSGRNRSPVAAEPVEKPVKTAGQRPPARAVDGDYRLPSPDLLTNGDPPRARSKANDTMIEAISGVSKQFSWTRK